MNVKQELHLAGVGRLPADSGRIQNRFVFDSCLKTIPSQKQQVL